MNNTNSLLNKAQTQLRELIKTLYNELRAEDLDTAKTFNKDIDMLIILLKKLEEECKENKYNYDDYIIFLLSTDNFDISKKIRDMINTGEYGMNEIFEYCQYIARKFEKYDEDKYNYLSQYESFSNFLKEYDIEINNYLDYGTEFKIVEQK